MKQTLKESFPIDFSQLHESSRTHVKKLSSGRWQVRCKGQHCGVVNRNKRVYPAESTWGRHTTRDAAFMKRIKSRRVTGQLEHPADGKSSMGLAACVITDVTPPQKNGEVYVTWETMSTDAGKIVECFIRDRVGFGISSRGNGSVVRRQDGVDEVQPDFEPTTFDLVIDESTPGAEIGVRQLEGVCESLLMESAGNREAAMRLGQQRTNEALGEEYRVQDVTPFAGTSLSLMFDTQPEATEAVKALSSAGFHAYLKGDNVVCVQTSYEDPAMAEAHIERVLGAKELEPRDEAWEDSAMARVQLLNEIEGALDEMGDRGRMGSFSNKTMRSGTVGKKGRYGGGNLGERPMSEYDVEDEEDDLEDYDMYEEEDEFDDEDFDVEEEEDEPEDDEYDDDEEDDEEESVCSTPGAMIRSGGRGRGMAVGRGRGPIGRMGGMEEYDSPDLDTDVDYDYDDDEDLDMEEDMDYAYYEDMPRLYEGEVVGYTRAFFDDDDSLVGVREIDEARKKKPKKEYSDRYKKTLAKRAAAKRRAARQAYYAKNKKKIMARQREYRKTEKGKAAYNRYNRSERGKENKRRWADAHPRPSKGKARTPGYMKSKPGKIKVRKGYKGEKLFNRKKKKVQAKAKATKKKVRAKKKAAPKKKATSRKKRGGMKAVAGSYGTEQWLNQSFDGYDTPHLHEVARGQKLKGKNKRKQRVAMFARASASDDGWADRFKSEKKKIRKKWDDKYRKKASKEKKKAKIAYRKKHGLKRGAKVYNWQLGGGAKPRTKIKRVGGTPPSQRKKPGRKKKMAASYEGDYGPVLQEQYIEAALTLLESPYYDDVVMALRAVLSEGADWPYGALEEAIESISYLAERVDEDSEGLLILAESALDHIDNTVEADSLYEDYDDYDLYEDEEDEDDEDLYEDYDEDDEDLYEDYDEDDYDLYEDEEDEDEYDEYDEYDYEEEDEEGDNYPFESRARRRERALSELVEDLTEENEAQAVQMKLTEICLRHPELGKFREKLAACESVDHLLSEANDYLAIIHSDGEGAPPAAPRTPNPTAAPLSQLDESYTPIVGAGKTPTSTFSRVADYRRRRHRR